MVEFYLLTFPRFPLRKKEHKSYFGKNRTHDFRTSRYAAYLLDHSGGGARKSHLKNFQIQMATRRSPQGSGPKSGPMSPQAPAPAYSDRLSQLEKDMAKVRDGTIKEVLGEASTPELRD